NRNRGRTIAKEPGGVSAVCRTGAPSPARGPCAGENGCSPLPRAGKLNRRGHSSYLACWGLPATWHEDDLSANRSVRGGDRGRKLAHGDRNDVSVLRVPLLAQ